MEQEKPLWFLSWLACTQGLQAMLGLTGSKSEKDKQISSSEFVLNLIYFGITWLSMNTLNSMLSLKGFLLPKYNKK